VDSVVHAKTSLAWHRTVESKEATILRKDLATLVSSSPYTPLTAAEQKLPVPIWVYQALFSSDFPYWVLQKVARSSLEPMFDITPVLRAESRHEEPNNE
jgi:hypothetical protein